MPHKNLFIVFEGIDYAGSSTQTKRFANRLYDDNKPNHILLTREPFDPKEEIRRRLAKETDAYSNAELMEDLFIEDRHEHVNLLIQPAIALGLVHIISDRYMMSTIAYQSTQGLDMGGLIESHNLWAPVPDMTFFIDVPAEVAMQRMAQQSKRKPEPKFEQLEFQQRLRKNYLEAIGRLRQRGENISIIDGSPSIERVSDLVWKDFIRIY